MLARRLGSCYKLFMVEDFKKCSRLFLSFFKQNKKLFFILLAAYCFAFIAIWRANYYYADDVGRAVVGYGWTSDFNRYSSSALQFFLVNMNLKLVDLSPYTQVLALALTALSSMMLIYLFSKRDKKPSFLAVAASAFLGLCPYTVACFVYKFDAPCMALALFASILPFLFYDSRRPIFFAISTICLLVMWTSYQSYSGIYVILTLAIALKSMMEKEKFSSILKRTLFCVLPFFLAVVLYKFCLPEIISYRSLEVYSFTELIPGLWGNFFGVISKVWSSFNDFWKLLAVLFCAVYLISFFLQEVSIKQKLKNFFFGSVFMILSLAFATGATLLLKETYYPPRSFCGFSVVFAVLGLFIAYGLSDRETKHFGKIFLALPVILLLYQFFVFEIAFGNALADQWRYSSFRIETLARDLSELFSDSSAQENVKLQIRGDIGYSEMVSHVAKEYPIMNELITDESTGLSEHVWGVRRLYYNYGLNFGDAFVALAGSYDYESMEMVKDTSYHTIYIDDDKACVVLK